MKENFIRIGCRNSQNPKSNILYYRKLGVLNIKIEDVLVDSDAEIH